MKISEQTKKWLLKSQISFVRYNAVQFFNSSNANKDELLSDPFIRENIKLLHNWDTEILKQHNKPGLLMHRFAMLADLGVTATDNDMGNIIEKILKQVNEKGIPQVLIQIPKVFGGTDIPGLAWTLCDFPTVLYGLLKMGVHNKDTEKMIQELISLAAENGYRCVGSISKFRGPGRKTDICPLANIIAAKALSQDKKAIASQAALKAAQAILEHWDEQGKKKYYLFGIGTDFKKLKFPLIWYNLLHALEVLSHYRKYHNDSRLIQMADLLLSKAEDGLRFKPESMYRIYKEQDFSNKKEYSPTITLIALKILKRLGKVS